MFPRHVATAALAALAIAGGANAAAQPAPPEIVRYAAHDDRELQSFAAAVLDVKRITDIYMPQLRAAATADEREGVETRASAEMERAVTMQGFTVARFNAILAEARTNPVLVRRIRYYLGGED